ILAVTRCPLACRHLRRAGAHLLDDSDCTGLNAAVSSAASVLEAQGVPGFLTVPGDIPAVSPLEVERVAHSINKFSGLTLVPAADGQGTNCLAMSPPKLLPPLFGPGSVEAHTRAATGQNIEVRLVSLPGFGFDVDTPEDLRQVNQYPQARQTASFLDSIGFAEHYTRLDEGVGSDFAAIG
ncbi:uncharacterized protein METZ01_LOCUS487584, partial [marine metagenome]